VSFIQQNVHGHASAIRAVDEGRVRQGADHDDNEVNTTTVNIIPTARTTGRGQGSNDILPPTSGPDIKRRAQNQRREWEQGAERPAVLLSENRLLLPNRPVDTRPAQWARYRTREESISARPKQPDL
jgi:hypothetical protein